MGRRSRREEGAYLNRSVTDPAAAHTRQLKRSRSALRMPSIVTTQRQLNTEALKFVGLTASKCHMTVSDGG